MTEAEQSRDKRKQSIPAEDDQRFFRAVFDHTFQFIGICAPDGTLLDVNKTALDFIGKKREDVVGKFFWETDWWTDDPVGQAKLKHAIATAAAGKIARFDAEHSSHEGSVMTVDFSLSPVLDEAGNVELLVPEGRDITERIAAERSLAEREARNRAIVDTAPDGICTVTMDGRIESANLALHQQLGFKQGELIGQPINKFIEDFQGNAGSIDNVLQTGERKLFGVGRETTATRKNRTRFPVEIGLSLLNLGHSQIFIAVVRDISERKKSQQLQAQLAAIVESSEDAIMGVNMEGIITAWNPAAENLYGLKIEEAVGQVFMISVPEDRREEAEKLYAILKTGEAVSHFETVRQRRDGSLFDVDLTMSPIRNSQGQVVGVSAIARDISARKEAERRISEFYSTVSHELRTPLTSIRASLGLLEGGIAGQLDDEAMQLVQIARAESDRLILLINDILDLRKIEAGKLELKLKEVQVSNLIDPVLESLRAMADEYGVRLKASYETDWSFVADPDRITQVIHNLLSNAIKYSYRSGEVQIIVAESGPECLRFSVIDHGPGIRADQMHKLFGKFQQLDSSDTRAKGGTGLGLAITKAIVEQHGGCVGVDSTPGEGSTFWFVIPKHEVSELEPDEKTPALGSPGMRSAESSISSDRQPFILIVEDDRSTQELLSRQLERHGFACSSASDGLSAVQQLQKHKPDLLILDVGIPAPDGFELVRILRKSDLACIPLLVYTSMDLSEQDKLNLSLGPSKHLIKSTTSQNEVILSVKELLSACKQEKQQP